MNINQVMRGILGDAVSNDVRTMELRVGQVVRGVVVQQLDNSEALVNINGVQVRAKLEIPLMEGQAALMQVQPESQGSYILLKQVDPASIGINDPMKDILKSMNLPDKAWAHELVRELRKEGFPLNRETALAFGQAAQAMPPGANQEQWMLAAAAVFKRGLPMTQATIASMNQLLHGTPLHSLVDQLKSQLQNLIASNQGSMSMGSQAGKSGADVLAQRLIQIMTTGMSLSQSIIGEETTVSNSSSNGSNVAYSNQATIAQQQAPLSGNATSNAIHQNHQTQVGMTKGVLGEVLKLLGVDYEQQLSKEIIGKGTMPSNTDTVMRPTIQASQQFVSSPTVSQAASTIAALSPQNASTTSVPLAQTNTSQSIVSNQTTGAQAMTSAHASGTAITEPSVTPTSNAAGTTSQSIQSQAAPSATNSSAILPQANGMNGASAVQIQPTESTQATMQTVVQSQAELTGLNGQQGSASNQQGAIPNQTVLPTQSLMGQENLKSALIQLVQHQDVPQVVKDTAQQMLQAITGQQLMLTTERTNSMFTHVTIYIPFQDQKEGQTAAVHIQTRRDRKGELDSENCRLVFDLNMSTLGPTLVDVNITNKIISLNIWNDHPIINMAVDQMRTQVNESLQSVGYMLSSLKAVPMPQQQTATVISEEKNSISPPNIHSLSSTRYKGVDMKV